MKDKIVINARFLTQALTGVQRYGIELSLRLKKRLGERVKFVAPHNILHKDIAEELNVKIIGKCTGYVWEQFELPIYLKKNGNPLLINFANMAPVCYSNKITILHDVTYLEYSSLSLIMKTVYKLLIPPILRSSKKIITVSQFSKEEIMGHYKIKADKIFVVHSGPDSIFTQIKSTEFEREQYVLGFANMRPNKNIDMIFNAFIKAKETLDGLKLYIMGDAPEALKGRYKKHSDIIFVGRISDAELCSYYNNALAFIYPSYYEGFGLPPIEAQACGCPVIVSNCATFPEIIGDSGICLFPDDVQAFSDAIIKLSQDKEYRNSYIKKGFENAKRFEWDKNTETLLSVIKK